MYDFLQCPDRGTEGLEHMMGGQIMHAMTSLTRLRALPGVLPNGGTFSGGNLLGGEAASR